ncbi:putative transmembrane protein [Raphanus sativus]|nr:putative transmembrane protein [Raphanus sativus]
MNLVKPLLLPTDDGRFQIYNFIWGKICFFFLLGITWKGMTLVTPLDVSIWDGPYLRFGFPVLHIRNHSRPLPQYEDLMLLVSHCFTHYEAVRHLFCLHLPQYEAQLPQYEDLMLLYEVHLPQYEAHLPQHEVYNSKILEMELKKPTLASYFQTCLSGRGGSCNSTAHYGCRFPHNSKAHQDGA